MGVDDTPRVTEKGYTKSGEGRRLPRPSRRLPLTPTARCLQRPLLGGRLPTGRLTLAGAGEHWRPATASPQDQSLETERTAGPRAGEHSRRGGAEAGAPLPPPSVVAAERTAERPLVAGFLDASAHVPPPPPRRGSPRRFPPARRARPRVCGEASESPRASPPRPRVRSPRRASSRRPHGRGLTLTWCLPNTALLAAGSAGRGPATPHPPEY